MLEMYEAASNKQWEKAIQMQNKAVQFFSDVEAFIEDRNEGTCDPVFDKGLAVAAGCLLGHQRCRPPYIGWSDETVKSLNSWLKDNYGEFIYPNT
jgi:hypothetical protein